MCHPIFQFCVVIVVVFILEVGPVMLHIVLVCCFSPCFSILPVTYSHVSLHIPVLRGDCGGVHPGYRACHVTYSSSLLFLSMIQYTSSYL